jgi:hypothetical protein
MLKAFKLEENSGVNAEGFFFQGHNWSTTDMRSDPSACILDFSARDHWILLDLALLVLA